VLINPLITTYLKLRHFIRETIIKTTFSVESLRRMRVALVKKAAGGFGAANLMGKPQMCLGGGRTPRRVIYAPVSERKNYVLHSGFSEPSMWWSESRLSCAFFFVKRLLNIRRKLDSKNGVSIHHHAANQVCYLVFPTWLRTRRCASRVEHNLRRSRE
jgi:hypothetical protein